MTTTTAMSLRLPPEFERAVLQRVQSGQYESADAVFAACLELLEREERDYDDKLAWLQRDLDVGIEEIERGEVIEGEQAFAEALAEFRQLTGAERARSRGVSSKETR
jgi:antitoxin ParD1/3/4